MSRFLKAYIGAKNIYTGIWRACRGLWNMDNPVQRGIAGRGRLILAAADTRPGAETVRTK
jgi:hypothetical protein